MPAVLVREFDQGSSDGGGVRGDFGDLVADGRREPAALGVRDERVAENAGGPLEHLALVRDRLERPAGDLRAAVEPLRVHGPHVIEAGLVRPPGEVVKHAAQGCDGMRVGLPHRLLVVAGVRPPDQPVFGNADGNGGDGLRQKAAVVLQPGAGVLNHVLVARRRLAHGPPVRRGLVTKLKPPQDHDRHHIGAVAFGEHPGKRGGD